MDTTSDLKNATRLVLNVSLHYAIQVAGSTATEKDRQTAGICISKPAGELEFTLNTKYLSISALQTNFDVLFKGTPIGQDRIHWQPQLPAGPVPIKTKYGNPTITNITGSLTTGQSSIVPPLGDTSCNGEPQAHIVTIDTVGDDNTLRAEGELRVTDDTSLSVSLSVSRLIVSGRAGNPEDFAVQIRQHPYSECVAQPVEKEIATFSAIVTGVPPGAPVGFKWTVDGAGLAPGTSDNAMILKVLMPVAPGPVTVGVVVTVTEQNRSPELSAELSVPVISKKAALALEFFCKIFMEARFNRFIRPLSDPLRGLVFEPMTPAQARQLRDFARGLSRLTEKLLQVYSGTRAATGTSRGLDRAVGRIR